MSCFICEVSEGNSRNWYDRVLRRNLSANAIPAMGSIAVGHVLVSPNEHVNIAQNLKPKQNKDFVRLLGWVANCLSDRVGPITIFEHGAPHLSGIRRSACIDHAHIHVVPGSFALRETVKLEDEQEYSSIEEFYSGPAPFDGYVMFAEPGDQVVVGRDVGQPQFLRQKIFATLGRPEAWDYALFPNEEAVAKTIELFTAKS